MNTDRFALIYNSARAGHAFQRGFCVQRVLVRVGKKYAIVSPSTARRLKLRFIEASNG